MSTLAAHWESSIAPVWQSHWGDSLIITTRAETQTLTGVVSRVTGAQEDEEGFQFISHDVDIFLLRSDVSVCIESGTRIEHESGGKTIVYEVLSEAGAPAWEYDDPQRTKLKIKAKIIRESDAVP